MDSDKDKPWTPLRAFRSWYVMGVIALSLCGFAALTAIRTGEDTAATYAVLLICFLLPLMGWLAWSDARRAWQGLPVSDGRDAIIPAIVSALYAALLYAITR